MKIFAVIFAALLFAVISVLLVIFSGAFNVAATNPDSPMTEWIFHTTMRSSVIMRSSGIAAPNSFTEAQVKAGFKEFRAMCAGCHGAPGKMRNAAGKGLRPRAPDLAVTAEDWSAANLFWIVRNGIKMTGMPAFGPTHDDQTIWNIVAFVDRLPKMTATEYRALEDASLAAGEHEH